MELFLFAAETKLDQDDSSTQDQELVLRGGGSLQVHNLSTGDGCSKAEWTWSVNICANTYGQSTVPSPKAYCAIRDSSNIIDDTSCFQACGASCDAVWSKKYKIEHTDYHVSDGGEGVHYCACFLKPI